MQDFKNICKFCNEIKLNLVCGGKEFVLGDILPDNICPLAFHSIYPYIITLSKGGWLNWVGHDEHVIVNCPFGRGVAMYVKAPSLKSQQYLEVEVMKIRENNECYKGYVLKKVFQFNISDENMFKLGLLYRSIPFILSRDDDNNSDPMEICYNFEGEKVQCQVEF
ncbi:hypothetical protein KKC91_03300 [bacterium]|nr:hypothetical protein [bacterium]